MFKKILVVSLCLAATSAWAAKSVKYGKGVKKGPAIAISELHARIDELQGKLVRVEGPVVGVCPKRGCWINLAGDKPFQELRFKVNDGEMVFPMSVQGKYAVVEGIAHKSTLTMPQTIEHLREEAAERGEPFDEATVKTPLSFVILKGVGAVVRDRK